MAQFIVKEIKDKNLWEKFVLSNKPKSFLQSWKWGETNRLMGDRVIRLGFFDDKKLGGVCLLIKQKAKRGPHFLIPAGPILDWGNKSLVEFFLKTLKRKASDEGVWFVRVRPELLDSKENNIFISNIFQ